MGQQIERWFGKITQERIRRSAFQSAADLERAIIDYGAANNKARSLLFEQPPPISSSERSEHFVLELTAQDTSCFQQEPTTTLSQISKFRPKGSKQSGITHGGFRSLLEALLWNSDFGPQILSRTASLRDPSGRT